jgi:glutaconyl-CoA decarboxylase
MAVGGGGILSGMSPKGFFDEEGAEALINAAKQVQGQTPGIRGSITTSTGFFRYVYEKRPRCWTASRTT